MQLKKLAFTSNNKKLITAITFTFFILLYSICSYAQDETKQLPKPENIIKVGILPDFFQPVVPIYFEHFLSPNLSLQTGFGYLLNDDTENWDMTGFNFRLSEEIRLYFPKGKWYTSFETRYMNKKCYTLGGYDYIDNQGMEQYYREQLFIKKQTLSFIPKIGFQSVRNHFSFDIWTGLGLKYRSVRYPGANPQSTIPERSDIFDYEYVMRGANKKGDYWSATFVFNITLGYAF